MRINIKKNKKKSSTNDTKKNKNLRNSYVYLYTYWNDFNDPFLFIEHKEKNETILFPELIKSFGSFPMKYKHFCKLRESNKINMILKKYEDLLLHFIYKDSPIKISAVDIDEIVMHGIKFTNINEWKNSFHDSSVKVTVSNVDKPSEIDIRIPSTAEVEPEEVANIIMNIL